MHTLDLDKPSTPRWFVGSETGSAGTDLIVLVDFDFLLCSTEDLMSPGT